ncbi:MAG: hypothetical protein L0Z07_01745 [Planctomycetes bacterium]|nr:hypothetical protein [Planctomycetota bacterium]
MTPIEIAANLARPIGLLVVLPGLWFVAGGLRVVVSRRIDEQRRSTKSLKIGLPLLATGLLLLFGGTWLANWAWEFLG